MAIIKKRWHIVFSVNLFSIASCVITAVGRNDMVRKPLLFSALLLIALCMAFGSCTKNQHPQTLFSNLVGRWVKTGYATDDNGSGIITPAEIQPQETGTVEILELRPDSTGFDSTAVNKVPQSSLAFNWYVYGDSLVIQYHAHDTDVYYVENVNSVNLTLYINKPTTGLAAYYFNK